MAEDLKTWLTLGVSGLALAGTVDTAIANRRSQRELARFNDELQRKRDERAEQNQAREILRKYKDPLVHAA